MYGHAAESNASSTMVRDGSSLRLLVVALAALGLGYSGCVESNTSEPVPSVTVSNNGGKGDSAAAERPTIGVLLTSHGDVDTFEEIEPYIRTAFLKNVGVPLPKVLRELLESPAYWLAKGEIENQYDLIGPTRYRESANQQVAALQAELDDRGVNARVYVGYNFMPEFIEDTLDVMRNDGIQEIVVFNKGAQYSFATLGESIDEVKGYLALHPEWNVKVTAVRQYSDDPRFIDLYVDTVLRDVQTHFPETPAADTCIFFASHGLPLPMIRQGDPAISQMEATIEIMRERLSEYPVYHGYLNDDYFPGTDWVSPSSDDVAWEIRQTSCPAVLMDSRLSFTSHHRATLYDLDVEAREILEEPDTLADGETLHPLYIPAKVVLGDQWDGDDGFARLLADLSEEALRGEGDLIVVQ